MHTFYMSQTPQTCLCKNFLSGVKFSRMSEKKCICMTFFRDIFSVFGDFSRFFGCKIWFRKSCLCKRNDKYKVWPGGRLKTRLASKDIANWWNATWMMYFSSRWVRFSKKRSLVFRGRPRCYWSICEEIAIFSSCQLEVQRCKRIELFSREKSRK